MTSPPHLAGLDLPALFEAIADGTAPADLQASCRPTGVFVEMLASLAERLPGAAAYAPLWGLNAFGFVAFDRVRRVYVRYYVGEASATVVARDYRELCAFLFLELMETGLWDELEAWAPLFRFEHLAALKTFVERGEASGPSHEAARRFVDGLGP